MLNADHDLKDMEGIALHISLCYILSFSKNWKRGRLKPEDFETVSYKELNIQDFSWHWSLEGTDYWELHNRMWPPHKMYDRPDYQKNAIQYHFNCAQSIFIQTIFENNKIIM